MRSAQAVLSIAAMTWGCIGSGVHAQSPDVGSIVSTYKHHIDQIRKMGEAIEPGATARIHIDGRQDRPASSGQIGESATGASTRDPFAQTPLMLHGGGASGNGGVTGPLPDMKLRGLAVRKGASVALIEISGVGIVTLRTGEEVTVRADQQPLTLLLKRINASSIEVEAGQTQKIVVR